MNIERIVAGDRFVSASCKQGADPRDDDSFLSIFVVKRSLFSSLSGFNHKNQKEAHMLSEDLMWWITVIEVPVVGALFWVMLHNARSGNDRYDSLHKLLEARHSQMRESLAGYKLEVAKSYAAASTVKEIEDRLSAQLGRIEAKLDRTALKAEALGAITQNEFGE